MASRAALPLLAAILPLTLGLRAANQGGRFIDQDRLRADSATAMQAEGWTVREIRRPVFGALLEGRRGDCRILLHFASPEGATAQRFANLSRPYGPIVYHRGKDSSAALPQKAGLMGWHLQRYAAAFGIAVPTAPVIAIASPAQCAETTPDLSNVRQHLRRL